MTMGAALSIHTSSDENGDKLVYHDKCECGYRMESLPNDNQVAGVLPGSVRCERCAEIAGDS
jgi:hypothetical protein